MSRYVPVPVRRPPAPVPQRVDLRRPVPERQVQRAVDPRFLANLAARSMTVLEPGYNQDEVFDDQFERRAREIQRTPTAQNAVSIIPAKQGPWSGNNQLGIEKPFAPDSNNRQTILRLDEWGFPEVWSLMLGLRYSDAAFGNSGIGFDVKAVLTPGVGGAVQSVKIDWAEGTALSLSMNALDLVAEYLASGAATPDDLRLIVTISKGKLSSRTPTLTEQISTITTGGAQTESTPERIPAFARSLMILQRGSAAASPYQTGVRIRWLGNPNGSIVVGLSECTTLLNFAPTGIPIPPFAHYWQLQVDGAVASVAATSCFYIGL